MRRSALRARLALALGWSLIGLACGDGDGSEPTRPSFPIVAGTYDIEQPRTGGSCLELFFTAFAAVVTQDDGELAITQTEPEPFLPYVGNLERDGDFTVSIARGAAFGPGLEVSSSVEGRFSGSSITATEVLTIFDVGATQQTREEVGLQQGSSSCTHVLQWTGTRR